MADISGDIPDRGQPGSYPPPQPASPPPQEGPRDPFGPYWQPSWPTTFAPPPPPPRRHAVRITVAALIAVACAAAAVVTGSVARAEMTRKPRSSELAAAAAIGLTQRWERISAGTIFPPSVGYSTDLLTQEKASRVGIGPATSCAAAVDQTLTTLTARYGCRGAVRASYADALDGAVYTVGVLAFSTPSAATSFYAHLPSSGFPATGLNTLALTGTATALFGDAARQSSTARRTGPYVVLAVAGYADGRPAAATGERRASVFAPASQIAGAVVAPLSAPEVVNCQDTREWSC
jgi:hypothetical protein